MTTTRSTLSRSLLPAIAGAALIVGGLDLTAYARDDQATHDATHQATHDATHDTAARGAAAPRPGHAFKYLIPKGTTVPFGFRLKGLPKGNYLASYDIAMSTSVDDPPLCNISDSRTPFAVRGFGTVHDGVSHSVASGLVHVARRGDAGISCDQGDTTITLFHSQNYVVLTPVTKVTVGDVGPIR